jgi:hypothetical protein
MGEDCDNNWGVWLVHEQGQRASMNQRIGLNSEFADGHSDRGFTALKDLFRAQYPNELNLHCILPNGSEANLKAAILATNGDFSGLMVAAGSYVVGSNSPLAVMTTSDFNPG